MKAGIFWVLIFLTVIGLSKSQEEPQNSEEIVSNEEASDAALLRNFFTVNLSSRNGNRRKGQNNNPRNFVESKRGTQQKRLGQLFQALSDPIGCKFFFFSKKIVDDRTYNFWFCRTVPRTVKKRPNRDRDHDRTNRKCFT